MLMVERNKFSLETSRDNFKKYKEKMQKIILLTTFPRRNLSCCLLFKTNKNCIVIIVRGENLGNLLLQQAALVIKRFTSHLKTFNDWVKTKNIFVFNPY